MYYHQVPETALSKTSYLLAINMYLLLTLEDFCSAKAVLEVLCLERNLMLLLNESMME